MRLLQLFLFSFCGFWAQAQPLGLLVTWKNSPLPFGQPLLLDNGDTVQIDVLRFYLSELQWNDSTQLSRAKSSLKAHLFDAHDSASFRLQMPEGINGETCLSGLFGIDSTLQAAGAQGGVLDPALGMYWTWHSGYIQLKIEGRSPRCTAADKKFQYHLGGFRAPFVCAMPFRQCGVKETLVIPLDRWVNNLPLASKANIMSPCAEAVQLCEQFAQILSSNAR